MSMSDDPVEELSPAQKRRERIFTMRLAGASIAQIATKERISKTSVERIISDLLAQPTQTVDEMRALENARLDLLQAPLLKAARDGDLKAMQVFLKLSERRSRLNGIDAPHQIQVSANIRVEMERQLAELESVLAQMVPEDRMLEDIVNAEIVEDDYDDLA